MADSIPSLRRKLDDALAEIGRLQAQLSDVPEARVVNVPFKVIERVVEYHDNPEHLRMIAELQGRLQAWQAISQSGS